MVFVCGVGKVLASRDGYGTEPFFVGGAAVCAVTYKGVTLRVGGLAGYLSKGLFKVGVDLRGVLIIEAGELVGVTEGGIAGNCVGYLITEVEVLDDGAVAVVWES